MDASFLKKDRYPVLLRPESFLAGLFFIIILISWECAARNNLVSTLFFPAPSVTLAAILRMLSSGDLTAHIGATLSRVIWGFVIGSLPALILGLAMGWSRRLRVSIDPLVAAAHPIPKIAILPLIMIIFGIGESSKVITVAAAAFFPMLINAMAGVQQISPTHFEVAENYGAGRLRVFTRVVVPGSLPMVITGARLALNIALLLTISIELIAAQEGLGVLVWFAWETMRTEELYAGIAVIATLGIGFNLLLHLLRHYLVPWERGRVI